MKRARCEKKGARCEKKGARNDRCACRMTRWSCRMTRWSCRMTRWSCRMTWWSCWDRPLVMPTPPVLSFRPRLFCHSERSRGIRRALPPTPHNRQPHPPIPHPPPRAPTSQRPYMVPAGAGPITPYRRVHVTNPSSITIPDDRIDPHGGTNSWRRWTNGWSPSKRNSAPN